MHLHSHANGQPLGPVAEADQGECTKGRNCLFIVPCLAVCYEDDDGEMRPLKVFERMTDAEKWVRRRQPEQHAKTGQVRGSYKRRQK